MKFLIFSLIFLVNFAMAEDWKIASKDHQFSFPRDHGSHPEYAIEWWYLTGHLFAKNDDRRFGYQATFFRLGQQSDETESSTPNGFDDSQIYMSHMAVTDLETGKFFHEERLNREGWDAFARVKDLDVRNGNWTLQRTGDDPTAMRMTGSIRSDVTFDVNLTAAKPHVLFGDGGVSRKGKDPASASLYITFTRLITEGTLRLGDEEIAVTGSTWMDHEISSSQLDANQVGWDWCCIQLNDGREIMAYILREDSGAASPYSSCNWINREAEVTVQKNGAFIWRPGGEWTSPETGATWPISPTIETNDPETGMPVKLTLRPLAQNQEMQGHLTGVTYWEGACEVLDDQGELVGQAYLELTGYAGGKLKERLRPMNREN